jgi:hypothetical protein
MLVLVYILDITEGQLKPDIIRICREENGTYQRIQIQILSESEKKQE